MGKGIITEYKNNCIFCGRPTEAEHHLVFGHGFRNLAEEDGLKIPVCNNCHNMNGGTGQLHNNIIAERLSKIAGQLAFEKRCVASGRTEEEAREEFRKRYGRSYL